MDLPTLTTAIRQPKAGRLVAVDIARLVALLGIVFVHTQLANLADLEGISKAFYIFGNSVCPAIFAILTGLSMGISASRRATTGPLLFTALLLWRALILAAMGFYLATENSAIAIILVNLAVLGLLGAPLAKLSTRSLAILLAAWVMLVPQISFMVRPKLPLFDGYSPLFSNLLSSPFEFFSGLLFTGYYPLVNWLAYFMVGLILYRLPLHQWAYSLKLAATGVVGYLIVGWASNLAWRAAVQDLPESYPGEWSETIRNSQLGLHGTVPTDEKAWLLTSVPHSGTTPYLLLTILGSVAVIASAFLIWRAAQKQEWAFKVLQPISLAGGITFSLYSLHVLSLGPSNPLSFLPNSYGAQILMILVVGGLCGLLRLRGPLEAVSSLGATTIAALGRKSWQDNGDRTVSH